MDRYLATRALAILGLASACAWLFGSLDGDGTAVGYIAIISFSAVIVSAMSYLETRDFCAPPVAVPLVIWLLFAIGFIPASLIFGTEPGFFWVVILGLIGISAGALIVPLPELPQVPPPLRTPHRSFLRLFLIVSFGAGLAGFLGIVVQSGIPLLNPDVAQYRIDAQQSMRFFGYLSLLLKNFQLFIYIAVAALGAGVFRRRLPLLVGVVLAFAGLGALGNRGLVLFPLFSVVVIYHYTRGRLSFSRVLAVGALLLLTTGLLGYVRAAGGYGLSSQAVGLRVAQEVAIPAHNLDVILRIFPDQEPYMLGAGLTSPLLTVLPGKQLLLDWRLKELSGLDFAGGGLPPTLIGTLYLDFGPVGVVFGGLAIGFLLALVYRRFRRTNSLAWLLFFVVILEQVVTGMRNAIALDVFLVYVGLVLLLLLLTEQSGLRLRLVRPRLQRTRLRAAP